MIYVLKLENDCFYVGCTNNLTARLAQHFDGHGSMWTKKHKPIECIFTQRGNEETESEVTLMMMKKYGWKNVRGAAWCQRRLELPPVPLRIDCGDYWIIPE